ncbi:NAD(P)H-dependent oxidoreductase [Tuanshanicoccus lijuaniae]|uniref:NAD(P)H-dependent oxidoreductase n=1 Tax=Aerococcaceae bacterium zg-1292 TaxID=2774330 RepID=UPI001BD90DC3|nr:NAD(P)H-dependent oxidoreductase [Aerococcaceae bacterium zg-BR22]MBS4455742.1 NAD(P)H-dependent oxidoreductase [Aerococcaceae bacterium zg-A91]MBS4457493.1 NAD(P)H-dependent oxidoreductase [Aerococcaceae bacterium zg-BR33]
MKIIGLVGTNAEQSYNRQLLQYIQRKFKNMFEMEIMEIKDLPLFNQDEPGDDIAIRLLDNKIKRADGVIIATPEHNHTIPTALKSALEWLSFKVHPLENKPVMIVGASYYDQGSSRAQLHLRQILDAPGVNAYVLPGNEFLLGKVKEAFDEDGNLKEQRTIDFLESCLQNFVQYVNVIAALRKPQPIADEDLTVSGKIATTIEGVDPDDPEWVEKAAEIVGAAEGNDYVKLDRGVLTVDQLNMFMRAMPFEFTYADDNNQFLYYNRQHQEPSQMVGPRAPEQAGNRLSTVHPPHTYKNVSWVIGTLRAGNQDHVRVIVPQPNKDLINVHNYQAMYYPDGSYAGINELIFNFKPWLDWYLKETGQRLVGGNASVDATSSASQSNSATSTDATSGASESTGNSDATAVDTTSGASEH